MAQEAEEAEKTRQIWQQRIEQQRRGNQTAHEAIVEQLLHNAALDQQGKSLCRKIQQSETISNRLVEPLVSSISTSCRILAGIFHGS